METGHLLRRRIAMSWAVGALRFSAPADGAAGGSPESVHRYTSAPCLGAMGQNYGPGVPVLHFADAAVHANEELVRYLVWANPENAKNLRPGLGENARVFEAALNSPFYARDPVARGSTLVLQTFACFASDRDKVLDAVRRSGRELGAAAPEMRADPYLVAWAGAPVGASEFMTLPSELVCFLKTAAQSALSVAYVEANSGEVFDAFEKYIRNDCFGANRRPSMSEKWKSMRAEEQQQWCTSVWSSLVARCPFFFRVAPAVRDVLWPTPEDREGTL